MRLGSMRMGQFGFPVPFSFFQENGSLVQEELQRILQSSARTGPGTTVTVDSRPRTFYDLGPIEASAPRPQEFPGIEFTLPHGPGPTVTQGPRGLTFYSVPGPSGATVVTGLREPVQPVPVSAPSPLQALRDCARRIIHLRRVADESRENHRRAVQRGDLNSARRFEAQHDQDIENLNAITILCDSLQKAALPTPVTSPTLKGFAAGRKMIGIVPNIYPDNPVAKVAIGGSLAASLLGVLGASVQQLVTYGVGALVAFGAIQNLVEASRRPRSGEPPTEGSV